MDTYILGRLSGSENKSVSVRRTAHINRASMRIHTLILRFRHVKHPIHIRNLSTVMVSLPVRALECFRLLRGRVSAIVGCCGGGGKEENHVLTITRQRSGLILPVCEPPCSRL